MSKDLQKLRERLNGLLNDMPINAQEVLSLSREVDRLIVEFYKERK